MHVLVIEDSDIDFLLVQRALAGEFRLKRATSLEAGLSLAKREQFDLIILDLFLDDSQGYETFERARQALPYTPILVLSGVDDDEVALRAVSNGAYDYVRRSRLLDYPLDRAARYAVDRGRAEKATRRAERNYRVLFENLPIAAYKCDPSGAITYFNQKAVELWGRAPTPGDPSVRFCGSVALYNADGSSLAHQDCAMACALRDRNKLEGVTQIMESADGQRHFVLAHVNPVFQDNGELRGAINVLVDISSQRLANHKIRESERLARATVNSLTANLAILDATGTIVAVNAAWERQARQCGMTYANNGVGSNYLEVCDRATSLGDDSAGDAAECIRKVLRRETDHAELEYPCHSPTEQRWMMMRVTPFDGEGPTRAVVSHDDVTARKIAERLTREQSGLRDAVAGMEQVLGVVGHELRTPLAALRAISEFLCTDGARNTVEADQFLHEISEEVDRMSDTVNNLLEAARLNSGRAQWNWSGVDVKRVIDEALDSVSPLVDVSAVRLGSVCETGDFPMLGDSEAIRRLLINLLNNARKHTISGHIEVHAQCCSNAKGNWIEIRVTDTGGGISPELMARLGEAFALNSGVVSDGQISGTGLGIAICKGIAQAHGGGIEVQSVLKKGTCVIVRLRADLESAATGDTVRSPEIQEVAA